MRPAVSQASATSMARPTEEKLPKLLALFKVCADLFLDVGELGFHELNWADDQAIASSTHAWQIVR